MNLTEGASSHVALHIHLKLSLFQRRSDRVREFDGEAFLWLVAKTRTACSRECNQTARKTSHGVAKIRQDSHDVEGLASGFRFGRARYLKGRMQ